MSLLFTTKLQKKDTKPKEKEKTHLYLELYDFNFDSIFQHQDIYNSFYQFICNDLKILSYRQLDFLNETAAISSLPNFKAKQKFSEAIINRYIKKNGDRELYLSQREREEILKEYDTLMEFIQLKGYELAPEFFFDDIFTKSRNSILSQIKRDVFPKFQKSKECKNVLKNYVDNPKVIILTLVKEFPYKDKDFQIPCLTEKDFRMMYGIIREELAWDYIDGIGEEFYCYISDKKYFPNLKLVQNLFMTKIECTIPFPFQKVVCSLYNTEHLVTILPFLSSWDQVESLPYNEAKNRCGNFNELLKKQSFIISKGEFKYPNPFNNLRKSVVVSGLEYDLKKEQFLILFKPCTSEFINEEIDYNKIYEKLNEKKKKEYYVYSFDFWGFLVELVDEHMTKVTQIHSKIYNIYI